MPILKSSDSSTGYLAILSDTSLDRDDELMSKSLLMKFVDNEYLPGFLDHDTKALNQVCTWVNRKVVEKNGNHALIAEPKFFKSNDKARQIMGMMDEGAVFGVSISGVPKDTDEVTIEGKTYKRYTDIDKLEASFCGIQSNRNSIAMRIAKSFNIHVKTPEIGVVNHDEDDKKLFESYFEKIDKVMKVEDLEKLKLENAELSKKLADAEALKKEMEDEKKKEEEEKKAEEEKKKALELDALKKANEDLKKQLEVKESLALKKDADPEPEEEEEEEEMDKSWDLKRQLKKFYKIGEKK